MSNGFITQRFVYYTQQELARVKRIQHTDTTLAKHNRSRIAAGLGNPFFDRQSRLCEQWTVGELAPRGLVLAGVPMYSASELIHLAHRASILQAILD